MHKFEKDFYGEELRLVVTCYIRPEADFTSLDALISAIKADINFADDLLNEMPHSGFEKDSFLTDDDVDKKDTSTTTTTEHDGIL